MSIGKRWVQSNQGTASSQQKGSKVDEAFMRLEVELAGTGITGRRVVFPYLLSAEVSLDDLANFGRELLFKRGDTTRVLRAEDARPDTPLAAIIQRCIAEDLICRATKIICVPGPSRLEVRVAPKPEVTLPPEKFGSESVADRWREKLMKTPVEPIDQREYARARAELELHHLRHVIRWWEIERLRVPFVITSKTLLNKETVCKNLLTLCADLEENRRKLVPEDFEEGTFPYVLVQRCAEEGLFCSIKHEPPAMNDHVDLHAFYPQIHPPEVAK